MGGGAAVSVITRAVLTPSDPSDRNRCRSDDTRSNDSPGCPRHISAPHRAMHASQPYLGDCTTAPLLECIDNVAVSWCCLLLGVALDFAVFRTRMPRIIPVATCLLAAPPCAISLGAVSHAPT
jgi:hypothetical protein